MIRPKKGYILISVLVIMTVMLIITYFLADALFSETSIARNQKASTLSFHLAEAGTQEAIWRIQNDANARTTFLNTTNGVTTFSHNPALINNGAYNVTVQNTAKGAATITATGLYSFGLKQAQRVITLNVTQTNNVVTYDYDAALLVGGPNSGNIYLHNLNLNYGAGYDPSSIASGGTIDIGNANVNVNRDILANGAITAHNSTVHYGGTEQQNYPTAFIIPGIDVNSNAPTSYKSQAIAQGHYYTSAQFATLINSQTTLTGIYYVAGAGGITIKNKNITVNGLLISEGNVTITNANVTINHNPGPSGLLTLGSLSVTNANLAIQGLTYVGVQAAASVNANITITGALLAHDFSANNINLTLNFKKDWVNETLSGGGTAGTPVIHFQHWEEEY